MSSTSYSEKQRDDLKLGLTNEKNLKPLFEKYFDCNLTMTDHWATFDYVDDVKRIIIELKTRRTRRLQYKDVMVGANKMTDGIKKYKAGYRVIFAYSFVDCVAFWEYSPDEFDCEWIRRFRRVDRGNASFDMPSKCVFIPTYLLKKINGDDEVDHISSLIGELCLM